MSSIENTGGETLDPKLCSYVYPEGHEKAGLQCKGSRGRTGYCGGHSRVMARAMAAADGEGKDQAMGAAGAAEGLPEPSQPAQSAEDLAQASLTRSAAAWLASPKTQKRLQARWDDILDRGSDAELIRLVKELTDRVEGRATEARAEEEVAMPSSLAALRTMSRAERRALIMRHAQH